MTCRRLADSVEEDFKTFVKLVLNAPAVLYIWALLLLQAFRARSSLYVISNTKCFFYYE